VDAAVVGGWNNLYKLINEIAARDGVEITQYAYSEGNDSKKGNFTITIKFYVFIEGVYADAEETTPE
jgi:hypothetical protein